MSRERKLGPLGKIMNMIPGMSQLTKQMNLGEGDIEKQMGHMNLNQLQPDQAFELGRREGLGVAAVAIAAVSFLSLLGIEKALLAITLALLALRGTAMGSRPQRLGTMALVLGIVYTVTFAVVMIVFRTKLVELVHLLQKLG